MRLQPRYTAALGVTLRVILRLSNGPRSERIQHREPSSAHDIASDRSRYVARTHASQKSGTLARVDVDE
jgi:hypothetical protein